MQFLVAQDRRTLLCHSLQKAPQQREAISNLLGPVFVLSACGHDRLMP